MFAFNKRCGQGGINGNPTSLPVHDFNQKKKKKGRLKVKNVMSVWHLVNVCLFAWQKNSNVKKEEFMVEGSMLLFSSWLMFFFIFKFITLAIRLS